VVNKILKSLAIIACSLIILTGIVLLLPRLYTALAALPRTYASEDVPAMRTAIVFGAGLWRDGSPTPVLRDRVEAAAQLYFSGKVRKLLMSGTRIGRHNEPGAMRAYALALGIPEEDIVLDFSGLRTYDTCYRARHVFQVQQAILVTQSFHLPRALYTCNALGLPTVGVASDLREYRKSSHLYWNLREIPATLVALWELHIMRPSLVLEDPQPIYPYGSG
jgi:SanA protein